MLSEDLHYFKVLLKHLIAYTSAFSSRQVRKQATQEILELLFIDMGCNKILVISLFLPFIIQERQSSKSLPRFFL